MRTQTSPDSRALAGVLGNLGASGFNFARRRRTPSKRERATLAGFRTFVAKANPKFVWYAHCEALAKVLIRVANDEFRRVMVFMPPRHSKSEEVSRLFSAYYLSLHPDRWIGINSYAAELAYTLSRSARENFQRNAGRVKSDASAVKHWETYEGGGLWAAGVGGPITGKGFHLGIIDDPLKNAEEAASETIRNKQREWYGSTFYTREEPGGAIVIIQTRWHEDDLSGWLLSEEQGDEPERWHVVSFEALKERDAPKLPETCTLEPDLRSEGEALCPERYSVERLKKIAERVGGYFFSALFQQRPTAKEGSFFKVAQLKVEGAAPAGLTLCRGWDLAATEQGGDYTAGARIGKAPDGLWWITDVARGQWGPDEVERQLLLTSALDGRGSRLWLPQDPGQAGKKQASHLTRLLAGYVVKAEPVTGDKQTRAAAFAAQVNAGNVRMVRGEWNKAFVEELRSFPVGKHDDQVDAVASAFNLLNARVTPSPGSVAGQRYSSQVQMI